MKEIRKLAGQTAVYGLGTIIPRLLNYLLLTPFYTRIFEQHEYGVITELYAYLAFFLVLLTYGMETTYFRFAESEKKPDKVYSTSVISLLSTTTLFLLIIGLFNQPVADSIQYSSHKEYILWLALIIGMDAFSAIPFARLRRQNKAFRFAAIKLVNITVNIGLNYFFLSLCPKLYDTSSFIQSVYDPEMGVGYAFIANLVASGITLLLLIPELVGVKFQMDFKLWRKMIIYALPLLVVGLAGMFNEVADKILLKYLIVLPEGSAESSKLAMDEVGVYGANYKLGVLMTIFIQMFRYAAEPFFFEQANKPDAKKIYADVMKYFIIFGLIIFLGVIHFIDIAKYFIGADFREGLGIVPIILLANLFQGIFYNLSVWYKLNNITKYGAYIALTGSLVTLLVNLIAVPVIGYYGSAWGHILCYFSMIVFSYLLGRKFFPVNYPLKSIGAYFLLAMLLFLTSYLFDDFTFNLRISLNAGLFCIFIGIVFYFEKPLRFFTGSGKKQ